MSRKIAFALGFARLVGLSLLLARNYVVMSGLQNRYMDLLTKHQRARLAMEIYTYSLKNQIVNEGIQIPSNLKLRGLQEDELSM